MAGGPSGFDPQELTVEASLNRATIAEVDGVPDGVAGRPAAETCSRNALAEMAKAAGILPDPDPARLADRLGALTTSPDPGVRAGALLEAFGSRLWALIATLRHPDTPAHQGASAARRAYLGYWQSVERVWLAGGLLAAGVATPILDGARAVVSRAERRRPKASPRPSPLRAIGL